MATAIAEPLPSEKDALVRLVKGVVLAQGNVFIKELLRSRGIRIGTTKADFEANMIKAIYAGELHRHHVDAWLKEVEGWGDQHVYLFNVSKSLCNDPCWRDPQKIAEKVQEAGLEEQWNATSSLEYPPDQTLTGINFESGVLSFVWHKGREFWVRYKAKDQKEEIDGDTYWYKAHRLRGDRLVTRFELRPADGVAAAFLQIAVDEDEHKAVLETIKATVERLWSFDEFHPFPVPDAIKKMDTQALAGDAIRAQTTRLNHGSSYIEFGARSAQSSYQDSDRVREVRRVARRGFSGASGKFTLPISGSGSSQRKVRVQMSGSERRVKIFSQLTALQVWEILGFIKSSV